LQMKGLPMHNTTLPFTNKIHNKKIRRLYEDEDEHGWGNAINGIEVWEKAIYDVQVRTIKLIDEDEGRVQKK